MRGCNVYVEFDVPFLGAKFLFLIAFSIMALRRPLHQLSKCTTSTSVINHLAAPISYLRHPKPRKEITMVRRGMATIVPPVTQDTTSSKGPTAMVFMNMGGPSTTDEVGDFLSRLFVSLVIPEWVSNELIFSP